MFTISQGVCGIYLILLSAFDIKKHRLPAIVLVGGGGIIVLGGGLEQAVPILLMAAGVVPGLIFLLVSKLTGEAFGYGDSILILFLGGFLGLWESLRLLTGAFFLAALFAVAGLWIRRFSRKTAFPFVPFLTLAYVGVILL